jgi:hypothetical protein
LAVGDIGVARKHTKTDIRELLVQELTMANESAHHSWDMVRRIEAGELKLPAIHSEHAHELVRKLTEDS